MLTWDRLACLEFFEVEPELDETFGRSFSFRVSRSGVTVSFGVNEDTSDVSIVIAVEGSPDPLVEIVFLDCPRVHVVQTKSYPYLEVSAPGEDRNSPPERGVRLNLQPGIQLRNLSAN